MATNVDKPTKRIFQDKGKKLCFFHKNPLGNKNAMTFKTPVPYKPFDSKYLKNPINVGQLVSENMY